MHRPHPPDEDGQAAVELVAVLPLLAALLALAWQVVIAGHAAWAVTAAARAAARAAAIGADPRAAARAHLPEALERGLRIVDAAPGEVDVSTEVPRILPALPVGRVHATSHFRPQDRPAPNEAAR
jgi:hypothetical protein